MRIIHWFMIAAFLCTFSMINNTQVAAQDDNEPLLIVGDYVTDEDGQRLDRWDWYYIYPDNKQELVFSIDTSAHSDNYLTWSPDGQTAALIMCSEFITPDQLFADTQPCTVFLVTRSGEVTKIGVFGFSVSNFVWSEDSSTVAFIGVSHAVYDGFMPCCSYGLFQINRESLSMKYKGNEYYETFSPSRIVNWNEDNFIYFTMYDKNTNPDYYMLYRIDLTQDNWNAELVEAHYIPTNARYSLSPDRNWYYTYDDSGTRSSHPITITNIYTGESRTLTTELAGQLILGQASWTPDSQWLIFTTVQDNVYQIYRININSSHPELLVESTKVLYQGYLYKGETLVAPDGSAFLYLEFDRDEDKNIISYYRASMLSDERTLLMTSTLETVIEWVPPLSG